MVSGSFAHAVRARLPRRPSRFRWLQLRLELRRIRRAIDAEAWAVAKQRLDRVAARIPERLPVPLRTAIAKSALDLSELETAERVAHESLNRFPGQAPLFRLLAGIARDSGRLPRALEYAHAFRRTAPERVSAWNLEGRVLIQLGRFDEAESLYRSMAERWPDRPDAWIGLANISRRRERWDEDLERWSAVARRFPDHPEAARACVKAFGDVGRSDLAGEYLARTALPQETVRDCEQRLRQALDAAQPEDRLQVLDQNRLRFPHRHDVAITLCKKLVAVGRDGEAAEKIAALPALLDADWNVAQLKAWVDTRAGRHDAAKERVRKALEQGYQPFAHAPIYSLDRIHSPGDRGTARLRLFTVIRNELPLLPWFLHYYRGLGVERFHVVDNDSTDGSREYLRAQDDVELHWTPDSYSESGYGVRWINHLMEELGDDSWCLYADADEYLVYPGMDAGGLPVLLDYLEQGGFDAFRAFMLDMAPERLNGSSEYTPGTDPLAACPLFDPDYRIHRHHVSPYVRIRGGIRQRMMNTAGIYGPAQGKTPIVRAGRGIQFIASSHFTTPSVVADVTGACLHFKFLGDYSSRYEVQTRRKMHWAAGIFCAASVKALAQAEEEGIDYLDAAVRYRGVDQLVELGLVQPGRFPPGT